MQRLHSSQFQGIYHFTTCSVWFAYIFDRGIASFKYFFHCRTMLHGHCFVSSLKICLQSFILDSRQNFVILLSAGPLRDIQKEGFWVLLSLTGDIMRIRRERTSWNNHCSWKSRGIYFYTLWILLGLKFKPKKRHKRRKIGLAPQAYPKDRSSLAPISHEVIPLAS